MLSVSLRYLLNWFDGAGGETDLGMEGIEELGGRDLVERKAERPFLAACYLSVGVFWLLDCLRVAGLMLLDLCRRTVVVTYGFLVLALVLGLM